MHSVRGTSANVHDVTMVLELLTGEEETVYDDSGYLGAEKRKDATVRNDQGKRISYKINRHPSQNTIPRTAKTDRKIAYHVRAGESDFG